MPSRTKSAGTHLELKRTRDLLARQNADLEAQVARRTRDIEVVKQASIRALASLGETRDSETGHHILRTQLYIELLGQRLQTHPRYAAALAPAKLKLIVDAAPLHDIGKIGIRDEILLKPGKLTPEEFAVMKTHAALGGEALNRALREAVRNREAASDVHPGAGEAPLEFLQVARDIALCHHEKWDGSGYPAGLAGDAIPVSARLMALADVFDALISRRVYKAAMPLDDVRRIIAEGRGKHFDPAIVDIFFDSIEDFVQIARRYADDAGSTV
jgi:putative two-component system response regulator